MRMLELGTKIEKYIYLVSNGYKVDIRKGNNRFTKVFDYRSYDSDALALDSAIRWRDEIHLEIYGLPVLNSQKYGTPRNGNDYIDVDGIKLRIFSGIQLERKNGKPLYFTVTIKSNKKRFSIMKLGILTAHKHALDFNNSNIE